MVDWYGVLDGIIHPSLEDLFLLKLLNSFDVCFFHELHHCRGWKAQLIK